MNDWIRAWVGKLVSELFGFGGWPGLALSCPVVNHCPCKHIVVVWVFPTATIQRSWRVVPVVVVVVDVWSKQFNLKSPQESMFIQTINKQGQTRPLGPIKFDESCKAIQATWKCYDQTRDSLYRACACTLLGPWHNATYCTRQGHKEPLEPANNARVTRPRWWWFTNWIVVTSSRSVQLW